MEIFPSPIKSAKVSSHLILGALLTNDLDVRCGKGEVRVAGIVAGERADGAEEKQDRPHCAKLRK